MNAVQWNDVSNPNFISDHTSQYVHASSTISCIERRRRSGVEVLNVGEESLTMKEVKNEADLHNSMPYKAMNM